MKFPPEIRASTATMLSGTTIMMMAMAPQFEEILGSKLRAVPSDLLASQCLAMKKGKADFWNVHLGSSYRAVFGVEEYCTPRWGPQKIRMAWIGGPALLSMAVRANSGINTIQDLKGKTVLTEMGQNAVLCNAILMMCTNTTHLDALSLISEFSQELTSIVDSIVGMVGMDQHSVSQGFLLESKFALNGFVRGKSHLM